MRRMYQTYWVDNTWLAPTHTRQPVLERATLSTQSVFILLLLNSAKREYVTNHSLETQLKPQGKESIELSRCGRCISCEGEGKHYRTILSTLLH